MKVIERFSNYLGKEFSQWQSLLTALAIGLLGAAVFWFINFPSVPLTGAAAAVSVAGLFGVKTHIPSLFQNIAFVFLGINVGTAATPEMLASAAQWPLSIVVLSGSLLAGLLFIPKLLVKHFRYDPQTAGLASVPGHLSYVLSLSLSLESKADTTRISIIQSVRVLSITLLVPPILAFGFGSTGLDVLPPEVMSPISILLTFLMTFLVGLLFMRLKLPASFLLAGMFVSTLFHLSEFAPGRLPTPLSFASFLIMGILIGSRFSGQKWHDVRQAIAAGFWVTGANFVIAFIGALLVWMVLDVPLSQILIAFVPGGVEAMAAIAVLMGIDPTFVAAHHIARLLLLTLLIPMVLGRKPKP